MQNKKTLLLATFLAVIFTVSITGFGVRAIAVSIQQNQEGTDDDEDGIEDEIEDLNERTIQVNQEANQTEIESVLGNAESADRLEIHMSTGDKLDFQVSYHRDGDDAENETGELEFTVEFTSIIEYEDVNGNDTFDDGDTELSTLDLDAFTAISYEVLNISGDLIHHLGVSSVDGVFVVDVYIGQSFVSINDTLITPTQAKIDIGIQNFTFTSNTSRLALLTTLETGTDDFLEEENTEDEMEHISDDDEAGIETSPGNTTTGNFTGIFTWMKTAVVDGVSQNITVSNVETEGLEQKIYINYPHGDNITHDPKIGVAGILLQVPSFNIGTGVGLVVIATSLATVFVVARVYRRKNQ